MTTSEDIQSQEKRLHLYRRTLALSLEQKAMLGSAHVPPGLVHTISEARDNILHIKSVLRGWGVEVEDHPDDDDPDIPNSQITQSETIPTNHSPVKTQEEDVPPNSKTSLTQSSSKEESNDFEASIDWEKLEFGGNLLTVSRPKVRITFHMPYAFEDAKCEIRFSNPGLNRIKVSLNHTDILGQLMSGLDTSPGSGARRFIRKTDKDLFETQLGQTQINLLEEEALDLCSCIDIVCGEYKKVIMGAETMFETGNFLLTRERDIPGIGFHLISVQLELWDLICKFKLEFDYDKGDSEWHIFDSRVDYIRISKLKESRFLDHAFIYGRRRGESHSDDYVRLIYGLPKWFLETVNRTFGGWQNNIGLYGIWTATYTQDWLLNEFIPTVCQHYLGDSDLCYDLIYEALQPQNITHTSINQTERKIGLQGINQPNQLSEFINDIHAWFYRIELNVKSSTVIDFFNSFVEFAKDVEPATVNIAYIREKLKTLNTTDLRFSKIEKNEISKWNYSNILHYISNYTDYLTKIDFIPSSDIEIFLRVFGAVTQGKFSRVHQSRLNTLKKHMLPLWEESEFERRYVMTQWNWNGLWFEK